MSSASYREWMTAALEQAEKSWREGGIPIGSVLVSPAGEIVARGHNERVQSGDPHRTRGNGRGAPRRPASGLERADAGIDIEPLLLYYNVLSTINLSSTIAPPTRCF